MKRLKFLSRGVTAPKGFCAAGIASGIKPKGSLDLALLTSESPCAAAGVCTKNRFRAAPVRLTTRHLTAGPIQAVFVNSGNANACTGSQGERDAKEMATLAAKGLGIPRRAVCIASTGVIGEPLPMVKIRHALPMLIPKLSERGGYEAADAIMTTDTKRKEVALQGEIFGGTVTLGGMAKGAGMIHPNMATLLAFMTTDAKVATGTLRRALREAVDESFNRISVDGETSTNDMIVLLANGRGKTPIPSHGKGYTDFLELLKIVCQDLAKKVVWDGEGATKRVTLHLSGARNRSEAIQVATSVVRSPLVKTAFFGEDANWGRILAAIGASGVALDLPRIGVSIGDVPLVLRGMGQGKEAERAATTYLKKREFEITIKLGLGKAHVTFWTCDFSYDYIRINAGYRS